MPVDGSHDIPNLDYNQSFDEGLRLWSNPLFRDMLNQLARASYMAMRIQGDGTNCTVDYTPGVGIKINFVPRVVVSGGSSSSSASSESSASSASESSASEEPSSSAASDSSGGGGSSSDSSGGSSGGGSSGGSEDTPFQNVDVVTSVTCNGDGTITVAKTTIYVQVVAEAP